MACRKNFPSEIFARMQTLPNWPLQPNALPLNTNIIATSKKEIFVSAKHHKKVSRKNFATEIIVNETSRVYSYFIVDWVPLFMAKE